MASHSPKGDLTPADEAQQEQQKQLSKGLKLLVKNGPPHIEVSEIDGIDGLEHIVVTSRSAAHGPCYLKREAVNAAWIVVGDDTVLKCR